MKKKPSHGPTLNWRNVPEHDFFLVAKSFRTAAEKLVETLNTGPLSEFDICPVLSMYRRALELQLKVIILGGGGNFLTMKPDELSVHKSRSVSWLAQFVSQIIIAVKWEREFKCEGIENPTKFRTIVEEVNSIDPGFHAFRYPADFNVREFTARMDALLELLESTADALAATWDMQMGDATPGTELDGGNGLRRFDSGSENDSKWSLPATLQTGTWSRTWNSETSPLGVRTNFEKSHAVVARNDPRT